MFEEYTNSDLYLNELNEAATRQIESTPSTNTLVRRRRHLHFLLHAGFIEMSRSISFWLK